MEYEGKRFTHYPVVTRDIWAYSDDDGKVSIVVSHEPPIQPEFVARLKVGDTVALCARGATFDEAMGALKTKVFFLKEILSEVILMEV